LGFASRYPTYEIGDGANLNPLGIFQGSSFNDSSLKTTYSDSTIIPIIPFRPRQPGIFKSHPITISPLKINKTQIGMRKIDVTNIGVPQVNVFQDGISNTGISSRSTTQSDTTILPWVGTYAWSSLEQGRLTSSIIPTKVGTSQVNLAKIGSIQVDPSQHGIAKIDSMKIDSSKVSLPISVASQQLLSGHFPSHNSTPEIINVLNNSATKIWSDLIKPETSLDIDFQITYLPSGRLAEAIITGFDDSGRPSAGTILIDPDE
jgi:hypothetical protein